MTATTICARPQTRSGDLSKKFRNGIQRPTNALAAMALLSRQPPHRNFGQLQAQLGETVYNPVELTAFERNARANPQGAHRRRPRKARDQSDLSKEIAVLQDRDSLRVAGLLLGPPPDLDLAQRDDVEFIARIVLAHKLAARLECLGGEERRSDYRLWTRADRKSRSSIVETAIIAPTASTPTMRALNPASTGRAMKIMAIDNLLARLERTAE